MSLSDYLKLVQNLLTMVVVDENDEQSMRMARDQIGAILHNVSMMMEISGKADELTLRYAFNFQKPDRILLMIMHRKEFAGVPGQRDINKMKRDRLKDMIGPGC